MIEFNRKLELLELSFKYDKIKELFESEGFKACDEEEKQFLNICFDLLLRNYKTEGKIPLSKKGEELLIFLFNFKRIKDGDIPRYIYRYDRCKHAKESIEGKYIWMSSNSTFNDPFEGILHADYDNVPDHEIIEFYEKTKNWSKEVILKILGDFKKRRNLVEKIKETHERNIAAAGIFCCSETNDSITMWSYYAQNHEGVCLEYDILKDTAAFEFVIKMKYTKIFPPKVPLSQAKEGIDNEKSLLNVSLLTKSDCWENEKEVRIIKTFKTGKIEINPDCLKSIIFGMKCSAEKKEELIRIMLEKGYDKNTEIKRAVKAENEYRIEIKKVGALGDHIQELIK